LEENQDECIRKRMSRRKWRSARASRGKHAVTFLVVTVGIFAGAVVSGLMGFAFSAVAGAILLHVLPPTDAVPLMMACSIIPQFSSLVALRRSLKWGGSSLLIIGGVLGILPALYLLQHIDAGAFRTVFGIFLIIYAGSMLLRPAFARVEVSSGRLRDAFVGFGGGLIGGLTAMPGALPVIWCDLRGMPKDQQRGLVQPYIVAMQLLALTLMFCRHCISRETLLSVTVNLLALAAGTAIGLVMFRRIDDAQFRRILLGVLLLAGVTLAL
jgi:uncharacterized membrane protein YfcA